MSRAPDTKTDGIELHFCRDCGISIPIPDIESGRANPAVPGCAYSHDNCVNRQSAPEPALVRSGRARESGNEGALRLVASIALFYVVGVTTFLLAREVGREAPKVELPTDVAKVRDIHALDRKVHAFESATREALAQLKGNDSLQATALSTQRDRVQDLSDQITRVSDASDQRDKTLGRGVLALTDEVMGLKKPLGDIMERLETLSRPVRAGEKKDDSGADEAGPTVRDDEPKRDEPAEDPKVRAQVDEFIKQLSDRSLSDQTRYNAAVQLGDFGHPAAVAPLTEALRKDSYDLVRRAAAFSLGMLGKHAVPSVPTLIEGVGKQEEYVGYMCARALGEIAKATLGQSVEFGYDPELSKRQRQEVMRKWADWWEKNKSLIQSAKE